MVCDEFQNKYSLDCVPRQTSQNEFPQCVIQTYIPTIITPNVNCYNYYVYFKFYCHFLEKYVCICFV